MTDHAAAPAIVEAPGLALTRRSPIPAAQQLGRFGRPDGPPGLVLREAVDLTVIQVQAFSGGEGLGDAIASRLGFGGPPVAGQMLGDDGLSIRQVTSRLWLVVGLGACPTGAAALEAALGARASVVDLSHGRTLLRLQGPAVLDVLAQGISLDLHAQAFAPGAFAYTRCAHLQVMLSRSGSTPCWDLLVHRSFAAALWEWLIAAAAPVGCEVRV